METYRALGLAQSVGKHLCLLQRPGKYEEADYVESFLSLFAAGGDCLDDFHLLRQDVALQKLGLKVPSPEAARFFLNAFHEEEALAGRIFHQAFIPEETQLLAGLGEVNRDLIGKTTRREAPWKATIDTDATVVESDKREAQFTCLGSRGYQPVVAHWVEPDLVVADQFRDGNVPARAGLLEVSQKVVAALPPSAFDSGSFGFGRSSRLNT